MVADEYTVQIEKQQAHRWRPLQFDPREDYAILQVEDGGEETDAGQAVYAPRLDAVTLHLFRADGSCRILAFPACGRLGGYVRSLFRFSNWMPAGESDHYMIPAGVSADMQRFYGV